MKVVETNFNKFVTDASDKTIDSWMFRYIRDFREKYPNRSPKFTWYPIHFMPASIKRIGIEPCPVI